MIFSGMEHWGMVTIRETAMLYEEGVSSEAQRDWTAHLIAHELSHQVQHVHYLIGTKVQDLCQFKEN